MYYLGVFRRRRGDPTAYRRRSPLAFLQQDNGVSLTPVTGALTVGGSTPTLAVPATLTPTTGVIVVTGNTPTFSVGSGVELTPDTGAVTITGSTPSLSVPVTLTPITGEVVLTGNTPTFSAGGVGAGATVEEIWAYEIEPGITAAQAMRLMLAVLDHNARGLGSSLEEFLSADGTKVRLTSTVDGSGNRTTTRGDLT